MKKRIKALSCVLSIVLLVASVSVGGYFVSAEDAVRGSPFWFGQMNMWLKNLPLGIT